MEAKAVSYSSDLLQPPVGPGVAFVRKELRGTKNFSRGPPKTFRVEESSVVSRVRDLLPLLATADRELQQRMNCGPPNAVDIETVEEDEPHVEMDLAVIPVGSQVGDGTSSGDCSSGSDGEESEGEEGREGGREEEDAEVKVFPLQLPKGMRHKRRRVNIEELPCR